VNSPAVLTTRTSSSRVNRNWRRRSRSALQGLVAIVIAVLFVSPLLFMASNAFKNEIDAAAMPPEIIFRPTLETLRETFDSGYIAALVNSLSVVIQSTLIALALGILAGFSLAFNRRLNDKHVVFWILSTVFMPAVGVILPLYVVYNRLGLLDTQQGLIVLYAAMNLPIVVLIMRSYYLDIPEEIIEAAKLDGAGTFRIFRSIVIPVSAPGVATAGLLCAIFAWNEFFFALMLTSTRAATLPVFIASSQTTQGLSLASASAASLLTVLPLVVIGWVAQRHLAEGFTLGAVK
jgi:sorbitol/mannitol transport system permease protein